MHIYTKLCVDRQGLKLQPNFKGSRHSAASAHLSSVSIFQAPLGLYLVLWNENSDSHAEY